MNPPGTETTGMVAALPQLHPLDEFYARAGRALPRIEVIEGSAMPEPYRQLLVHQGDMTPTLEDFFKSPLHLRVLQREQRGENYFREVVLLTEQSQPVEFGAIKIFLNAFPAGARREILEETIPLGSILARHKIVHYSRPKAYLKFWADDLVSQALGLKEAGRLFGRRNTLSSVSMQTLAEIVEILPPIIGGKGS